MLAEDRENDPVLLFGKSVHREMESLFDAGKFAMMSRKLEEEKRSDSLIVVYGYGCAALHQTGDPTAFAEKRSLPYIFRRMYYL